MKVKCIENCTGTGYEDFKIEEEREVPDDVGQLLIKFKYAELISEEEENKAAEEKEKETSKEEEKEVAEDVKSKPKKGSKQQ